MRIALRLRNPVRVSSYDIVLQVKQARRIRFLGVPVLVSPQAAVRVDVVYECQ